MIRVVLDTSVLVSAVISPQGPNAQLFDLITAGKAMPCLSDVLLDEYHRVFSCRHLQHLDPSRITQLRDLLEAASVRVQPRHRLEISSHDDDNRVYECAEAAGADYIVTENTKHFKQPHGKTQIVNARQLLKLLAPWQEKAQCFGFGTMSYGLRIFQALGIDASDFGVGTGQCLAQHLRTAIARPDDAEADAVAGRQHVGRGDGASQTAGHFADEDPARSHIVAV